jgi:hypothetical protein
MHPTPDTTALKYIRDVGGRAMPCVDALMNYWAGRGRWEESPRRGGGEGFGVRAYVVGRRRRLAMADEELSDKFFDVSVHLARTQLEASLNRFRRDCFRVAKLVAQDVAAGVKPMDDLRKMDEFVRKVYTDQPREMAEWEEIMRGFEFSEDTVDDGK